MDIMSQFKELLARERREEESVGQTRDRYEDVDAKLAHCYVLRQLGNGTGTCSFCEERTTFSWRIYQNEQGDEFKAIVRCLHCSHRRISFNARDQRDVEEVFHLTC